MKAIMCALLLVSISLPVFSLINATYRFEPEYRPFSSGIPGTGFGRGSHGYEKFVDTIPVKKAMSLTVINKQGNVRIIGWDKPYMKVEAKKLCDTCKENLKQVGIIITAKSASIVIETKNPYKLQSITVHYTIYVPENLFITNVKTDGRLVLRDVLAQTSEELLTNI
ncbi:MAG: hypothetical protein J7K89_03460 [Candidatus Cloacimonetes bacterium]|nr:hypothetical protein [Candidatus Cloacimonadota bacterium]